MTKPLPTQEASRLASHPPEIMLELLVNELEGLLASVNGCAKILENPTLAPPEQSVPAVVPILQGNMEHLAAIIVHVHHYLNARQTENSA